MNLKKWFPVVVILFVCIILTKPFFNPGYFDTQDGGWAVVRLSEMERELKDFQIPPRWAGFLNHGYGYPLFSFTYPFPYYLGIVFRLISFNYVDTIKILFITSVFVSGLFMYLLGLKLGNPLTAFASALIYLTVPYRLSNLYTRGSLGESLAIGLFPLLILTVINFTRKPSVLRFALSSIVFGILILTHNVLALLFAPIYLVLLIWFTVDSKNISKSSLLYTILHPLAGICLVSYFVIPALLEKKFIALSQIPLADKALNTIPILTLLSPSGYSDTPSLQVGIFHLMIIIFILLLLITNRIHRKYKKLAITVSILVFICLFLTQNISLIIWSIPPLSFVDFPWRILGPLSFLISFIVLVVSQNRFSSLIITVLAIGAFIYAIPLIQPGIPNQLPDSYYTSNDATTTSMDELMPLWVKDKPKNRYLDKIITVNEATTISDILDKSNRIEFTVETTRPSQVRINTIYFPGWEFRRDDVAQPITFDNPEGLIEMQIPSGSYRITGRFLETPIRLFADYISIATGIILMGLVIRECCLINTKNIDNE